MSLPKLKTCFFPAITGSLTYLTLSNIWSKADPIAIAHKIQAPPPSLGTAESTQSSTGKLLLDGISVVHSVENITTVVPTVVITSTTLLTSLISWKAVSRFPFLQKYSIPRRLLSLVLGSIGVGGGIVGGFTIASAMSVSAANRQVVRSIMDTVGLKLPWN